MPAEAPGFKPEDLVVQEGPNKGNIAPEYIPGEVVETVPGSPRNVGDKVEVVDGLPRNGADLQEHAEKDKDRKYKNARELEAAALAENDDNTLRIVDDIRAHADEIDPDAVGMKEMAEEVWARAYQKAIEEKTPHQEAQAIAKRATDKFDEEQKKKSDERHDDWIKENG